MVEEKKVQALRGYLQNLFPDAAIDDWWEKDRQSHIFSLNDSKRRRANNVAFTLQFIADRPEETYPTILDLWRLPETLRENPRTTVIVLSTGEIKVKALRPD